MRVAFPNVGVGLLLHTTYYYQDCTEDAHVRVAWPIVHAARRANCRFTTYRHRFMRVAPAPRAKLIDSKNRGRASPVKARAARPGPLVTGVWAFSRMHVTSLLYEHAYCITLCLTLRPKFFISFNAPLGRFALGKTPRGPRCARQARQRLAN